MELERGALLADETCTGVAWCRSHSALVDAWLAALLGRATGAGQAQPKGMALVALGGYGRSELCPESDIDVMLVHDGRTDVATVADRVWYPIWDTGVHLGHSVCTVAEALDLAADDLETATAILSARHVAGDPELTARLASSGQAQWGKRARHWLPQLAANVAARHERSGEVAFRLEPDLKEGRGGLRDVHALGWSEAAHRVLLHRDLTSLASSYSVLLDARVELQRRTGRPTNVLAMQEQDEVAAALGYANADVLMAQVAEAARAIAWTSDDAWRRITAAVSRRSRRRASREVVLDPSLSPGSDPALVLRLAAAAARGATVIERESLERLATEAPPLPNPWPPDASALLVDLLRTGPAAVQVIEALDQRGIWTRLLPEWRAVRARPQRNAYHRFTVDRHLLETAAIAAGLADKVKRPDLLVLAALLHDLGKGCRGDHTTAGVALAGTIATRMGLPAEDIETLTSLVAHHLLLADVATRRDLDEPETIERVAAALGCVDRLELLAALTEADSMATGPAAWGPWKAELVDRLVQRVAHVLEGGEIAGVVIEPFPTPDQLNRLGRPGQHIEAHDDRLTIMTDDRQGLFSRVAGVLALHGLG
ncbi:MAG TPA: [protein-PII] uridylyltransferase, partial [Acidimicrobiales bacterium]|nr:[protein-PII] uridylyltransferase [Acidimicrobiales bacterium]